MKRRDFLTGLLCSASLPLGALAVNAVQAAPKPVNVVEQFGFVGDDRTDNYDAFHRWADHVNRVGGGHYLFPPGTYYVHKIRYKEHEFIDRRETVNSLIDSTDGLTITGYGAKIRLNGKFHRSARKGPDGEMAGLYTGIFMPFEIHRSRNLTIKGLEMDGGVQDMTRDPEVYEVYAHLIALHGCTDVLLEDLDLHHCQTDGIYLYCSAYNGVNFSVRPMLANRNVTLRNVKIHQNARGGIGVFHVYGLKCFDCSFNDNGYPGKYLPHPPQFGMDVEPDYVPPHVDILTGNVEFYRCEFMDNTNGIQAAHRARYQGHIWLLDCRSSNRRGGPYHMLITGGDMLIQGGVHDTGTGSISTSWEGGTGANVTFRDCEIRTSGLYGVGHGIDGNFARFENVKFVGTYTEAGPHGEMFLIKGNPGDGRKNVVRNCDFFIPAVRKSPAFPWDYEIGFAHTLCEGNYYHTDLPATGGQHFAVGYDPSAVVRGDRFRGTAPGPQDSIRPGHNSDFDTRLPLSKG